MPAGVFTPYSTVEAFFGALPSWVHVDDQHRIRSYQIYEEIYWNAPESFRLVFRGTENRPIYVPSGRIIVETANRYVGKGLTWIADPERGEQGQRDAMMVAFDNMFRREKFRTKYNSNKRFGLIRGDWVFHVTADDTKPEGTRISLHAVDPASYFPIFEDQIVEGGNPDRIVKVHLVERFIDKDNKELVYRQTYEQTERGVLSSLAVFEPNRWFADAKGNEQPKIRELRPPVLLPPQITKIPVYHIKNFEAPGQPFGSSEMRGIEMLMAGITQSMSDEDVALALEGLGVYTTSSGTPVDDDGNEVDWVIGPGRVIENVSDFKRVNGVGSVQPFQDHINSMFSFSKMATSTPDIAVGRVDVQVAESGVALSLSMAPIIAKAEEKDDIISDTINQMFFDLGTMWFPTYERQQFGEAQLIAAFGNKLPTNTKALIDECVQMMSTEPPMMSATTAREILRKEAGIEFSEQELARIIQEKQAMQEFEPADPFEQRTEQELGAGEENSGQNGQVVNA